MNVQKFDYYDVLVYLRDNNEDNYEYQVYNYVNFYHITFNDDKDYHDNSHLDYYNWQYHYYVDVVFKDKDDYQVDFNVNHIETYFFVTFEYYFL